MKCFIPRDDKSVIMTIVADGRGRESHGIVSPSSRVSGYSSLPRSCHSAGLDGAGMLEGGAGVPLSSPYCPDNTLPLLETVSEDQEIHARRNNG